MRERAEMMNGRIEFLDGENGERLSALTVPTVTVAEQETHA